MHRAGKKGRSIQGPEGEGDISQPAEGKGRAYVGKGKTRERDSDSGDKFDTFISM